MATRIGVDIGGTFTDLAFYNSETAEVLVVKVPTTSSAPEEGAIRAVNAALSRDELPKVAYFLHGTTVGLNALLERRGAKVGLLATKGFRDILEIRRGARSAKNPLFWHQPEPLVPRELRFPIAERIYATGNIHTPIEAADVRAAADLFIEEGVSAIAVAFINAYANPIHEIEAERLLRASGFQGEISLSHRVSREYREFERTSTTAIDAFVRGRMSQYLRRLQANLGEIGFSGTGLVTRSGGGSMTFAEAEQRPFETIMSGPVAGAEGAAELVRRHDLGDVICADVGGTSFDTCLIVDGRPELLFEGEIDGWPLQAPWVDVRSIGAGGGSIAFVDEGGLLRVGPQSAGAEPGPACYGRGGKQPTMTDAAHALGMLGTGRFESGLVLDLEASTKALTPLSERLSISVEAVAQGIIRISAASMANAVRELTVERGIDPTNMSLLAFGGAGPLMGVSLANEIGVRQVIIPPYAGNFSAWGLLGADITNTRSQTSPMPLSETALVAASGILARLLDELDGVNRGTSGDVYPDAAFDLRYLGQEHTLTVSIPLDNRKVALSVDDISDRFHQKYQRLFGNTLQSAVELVSVRATLRRPLPRLAGERPAGNGGKAKSPIETVEAYSFAAGRRMAFALVDRAQLDVGEKVAGPAVISESTTTTYLDLGFEAELDPSLCLIIRQVA